ncbi:hypothetical protein NADFUDRAFT_49011 [Nadsonia fulvescens var. elongata DSM 6958]|uniref:Uncharacterized protein n=1 Tax=Nadsonia fulvescens var. elongata DSM 6958 TaxID=857566 RepID=A0A1E3PSG8_9ASCO|nr:hypothetical protein NADFUDRAFT_49011 [Nadsonia fulvescens var. elongata DSM 6958]
MDQYDQYSEDEDQFHQFSSSVSSYPTRSLADNPYPSPLSARTRPNQNHPSHGHQPTSSQLLVSNSRLREALELEQEETRRLARVQHETRLKQEQAQVERTRLEADLVERDTSIEELNQQIEEESNRYKQLDAQLYKQQKSFIDEKLKWFETESQLEDTLHQLNCQIVQLGQENQALKKQKEEDEKTKNNADEILGKSRISVHTQTELLEDPRVIKKNLNTKIELLKQELHEVDHNYQIKQSHLQQEVEQLRAINQQLMQENESIQLLVTERAVLGQLNSHQALQSKASSGADSPNLSDNESFHEDNHPNSLAYELHLIQLEEQAEQAAELELEVAEHKRLNYDLRFKNRSLESYNRAMSMYIERITAKLLEFKGFERLVETSGAISLNPRQIQEFSMRVASVSDAGLHRTLSNPNSNANDTVNKSFQSPNVLAPPAALIAGRSASCSIGSYDHTWAHDQKPTNKTNALPNLDATTIMLEPPLEVPRTRPHKSFSQGHGHGFSQSSGTLYGLAVSPVRPTNSSSTLAMGALPTLSPSGSSLAPNFIPVNSMQWSRMIFNKHGYVGNGGNSESGNMISRNRRQSLGIDGVDEIENTDDGLTKNTAIKNSDGLRAIPRSTSFPGSISATSNASTIQVDGGDSDDRARQAGHRRKTSTVSQQTLKPLRLPSMSKK